MNLTFEYPILLLPIIVALAALITFLFYYKDEKLTAIDNKIAKYSIPFLRFFSILGILILLLNPLLNFKKTLQEQPVVIMLQDNSTSIPLSTPKKSLEDYKNNLQLLKEKLNKKYKYFEYNFDKNLNSKIVDFKGEFSNINNALNEALQKHSGENICAVILATDGIYNNGISPLYNQNIKRFPCYTVGLGDTSLKKDLWIRNLRYNDLVYLNDNFSILVDIAANHFNQTNSLLSVTDASGKNIFSKVINIDKENFSTEIEIVLSAEKVGMQQYKVALKPLAGEITTANNIDYAFVEIIDGRQKVLALYDTPHPDIKAIKSVITANKNYSFEAFPINAFKGNYQDYNLIILHGLPSIKSNLYIDLVAAIMKSNISTLIIHNTFTDWNILNSLQSVINIKTSGQNGNEASPLLEKNYNKFTLNVEWENTLANYPPIIVPNGKYTVGANAEVLAYQKIGAVATNFPLIVTATNLQKKMAFITGEGIWRWRLQETNETKHFDDLFEKLFQYISIKSDKRKFRLRIQKPLFSENEPVFLDAELYNESFELINTPDAHVQIMGDMKKNYSYNFDKTLNSYTLNAGNYESGNYKANATVNYLGKQYNASANFIVRPTILEATQLQADHNLLKNLSANTKAKFIPQNELLSLVDILSADENIRPLLFETQTTKALLDEKVLFAIILILLALEWFLRKYFTGT